MRRLVFVYIKRKKHWKKDTNNVKTFKIGLATLCTAGVSVNIESNDRTRSKLTNVWTTNCPIIYRAVVIDGEIAALAFLQRDDKRSNNAWSHPALVFHANPSFSCYGFLIKGDLSVSENLSVECLIARIRSYMFQQVFNMKYEPPNCEKKKDNYLLNWSL